MTKRKESRAVSPKSPRSATGHGKAASPRAMPEADDEGVDEDPDGLASAEEEGPDPFEVPDFRPVLLRSRSDGWSADKQVAFVQALAECGCVSEACRRVGMSVASAYALRARVDAQSLRFAWDAALDHAVHRLSDAAFSRAIHGVSRPVYFQGEQIGERRHYDERLTMFLLRYRDPNRYGAWNDEMAAEPTHPDAAALVLGRCLLRLLKDANADDAGDKRPAHPPHDPARRTGLSTLWDDWMADFEAYRADKKKPRGGVFIPPIDDEQDGDGAEGGDASTSGGAGRSGPGTPW